MLTHDAVAASALRPERRLGVDPARDRWLCCLPLAHVGGLSVVTRALRPNTPGSSSTTASTRQRSLDAAAAPGATLVSLVPTALVRLGDRRRRFRTILLGGSRAPEERPRQRRRHLRHDRDRQRRRLRRRSARRRRGRASATTARSPLRVPDAAACLSRRHRPEGRADGWLRHRRRRALRRRRSPRWSTAGLSSSSSRAARRSGRTPSRRCWPQHPAVDEVAVVGRRPTPNGASGSSPASSPQPAPTPPSLDELRELVRDELGGLRRATELVVVERFRAPPSGRCGARARRARGPLVGATVVNRLADETSPYLRQHADNPVDWYPWGDEALRRAAELDRPLFVSIGYSRLPLVPRDGTRVLRRRRDRGVPQRALRRDQGRPRGASRRRRRSTWRRSRR